jgi:hypothetical protein
MKLRCAQPIEVGDGGGGVRAGLAEKFCGFAKTRTIPVLISCGELRDARCGQLGHGIICPRQQSGKTNQDRKNSNHRLTKYETAGELLPI